MQPICFEAYTYLNIVILIQELRTDKYQIQKSWNDQICS